MCESLGSIPSTGQKKKTEKNGVGVVSKKKAPRWVQTIGTSESSTPHTLLSERLSEELGPASQNGNSSPGPHRPPHTHTPKIQPKKQCKGKHLPILN